MRRIRTLSSVVFRVFNKPVIPFVPISSPLSLSNFRVILLSCSASKPSDAPSIHLNPNITSRYDDESDAEESHSDCEDDEKELELDESVNQDAEALVELILQPDQPLPERKRKLDQCQVMASPELVSQVISRARNDWEAAFTFFLWAGKKPGYSHSMRQYHSMISILGKMRKFGTAWSLIDEMRTPKCGHSLVTWQTLLIMIRRYCEVHDVGRAINTFYVHKRFHLQAGMAEFQGLLSALCRYKHVKDAEHLLFCNDNVFPFNTKSFNIILNGWCNVIGSPREAHRIWLVMTQRSIRHDVVSYSSLISCHSKMGRGNLHKVIKIFVRMKQLDITPDRKVYNAVIFALANARFPKEAIKLLSTMEEKGISPNAAAYNSLIRALCNSRKIEEAKQVYNGMVQRGLSPSVQTYHAFFRASRTDEEVFMLLDKMRNMGCELDINMLIMLIRKFCRWGQVDNVFKLWKEMSEGGVSPDGSAYTVMVHGLFLNGKLDLAHKYYVEMKEKHYLPEPQTEEMIQAWLSGNQQTPQVVENEQPDCIEQQYVKPPPSIKLDA